MIYYVAHPNLDFSAKVDAPSTEKARTVFLDYLERNGIISRRRRQYVRENMVAEKLEHPETIDADIELAYSYRAEEGPAYRLGGEPEPREVVEVPIEERPLRHPFPHDEAEELEEIPEVVEVEPERPSGVSPIAKAATRGYV